MKLISQLSKKLWCDYDNTLRNRLCPRDKLVTQIWYKMTARERLAKYEKYRLLFLILIFFLESPTEVTRRPTLTHNGSDYAESRKAVPFGGPHDG